MAEESVKSTEWELEADQAPVGDEGEPDPESAAEVWLLSPDGDAAPHEARRTEPQVAEKLSENRFDALERRLRAAEQSIAKLEARSGRADPPAPRKRGDPLDLNAASFDDLRAIGLSITQAARLIGYRDSQGGFKSHEDLDQLHGFPRKLLAELGQTTRI